MEEMTQRSASLVAQAEVAAHHLEDLSVGLGDMVATFTLDPSCTK